MKYKLIICLLLSQAISANFFDCPNLSFYVGGDLGLGMYSHRTCDDGKYNKDFKNKFEDTSIQYNGAMPHEFIGGGRVGLIYDAYECWYLALEGNAHVAKACSVTKGFSSIDINDQVSEYRYFYTTKTNWIAGIHGHIGYYIYDETVFYGIIGGKYLRGNFTQDFVFDANDSVFPKGEFSGCNLISRWGWALGGGFLVTKIWCNLDLRFESIYCKFGRNYFPNNLFFESSNNIKYNLENNIYLSPRLFYTVVSIAYNF